MRITVLGTLEQEGSDELDAVIPQVAKALEANGHQVSILGVHGDLDVLEKGIKKQDPEMIMNLLEDFGDGHFGYIGAVGVLELLGRPFTGGGPGELYIAGDKVLTKKLLAFEGVPFPKYAIFTKEAQQLETGGKLKMPLFVKPVRLDASIGIDAKCLVHDAHSLWKRVIQIHEELKDSALAEEYIEGRELYVGIVGNRSPAALPPVEMDFSGLPEGSPRVLDSKAKWAERSVRFKGTKAFVPELPDELKAKLQQIALAAYTTLRCRDYARVDMRMATSGEIYVLEVNPSCYLERSSELAMAAEAAGISFEQLVQQILDACLERYNEKPRTRKRSSRAARGSSRAQ